MHLRDLITEHSSIKEVDRIFTTPFELDVVDYVLIARLDARIKIALGEEVPVDEINQDPTMLFNNSHYSPAGTRIVFAQLYHRLKPLQKGEQFAFNRLVDANNARTLRKGEYERLRPYERQVIMNDHKWLKLLYQDTPEAETEALLKEAREQDRSPIPDYAEFMQDVKQECRDSIHTIFTSYPDFFWHITGNFNVLREEYKKMEERAKTLQSYLESTVSGRQIPFLKEDERGFYRKKIVRLKI